MRRSVSTTYQWTAATAPAAFVLVEGRGYVEHRYHIRDPVDRPITDVLVKGRGSTRTYSPSATPRPRADVLVKGRSGSLHGSVLELAQNKCDMSVTHDVPRGNVSSASSRRRVRASARRRADRVVLGIAAVFGLARRRSYPLRRGSFQRPALLGPDRPPSRAPGTSRGSWSNAEARLNIELTSVTPEVSHANVLVKGRCG